MDFIREYLTIFPGFVQNNVITAWDVVTFEYHDRVSIREETHGTRFEKVDHTIRRRFRFDLIKHIRTKLVERSVDLSVVL